MRFNQRNIRTIICILCLCHQVLTYARSQQRAAFYQISVGASLHFTEWLYTSLSYFIGEWIYLQWFCCLALCMWCHWQISRLVRGLEVQACCHSCAVFTSVTAHHWWFLQVRTRFINVHPSVELGILPTWEFNISFTILGILYISFIFPLYFFTNQCVSVTDCLFLIVFFILDCVLHLLSLVHIYWTSFLLE